MSVFACLECGLRGWHFDDPELGEFFEDARIPDYLYDSNPELMDRLRERAAPAHLLRELSRVVMQEGQRRKMEAAFATAYTSFQNEEPAFMVLEDILNQAELAIGGWFDMPFVDDAAMGELVADMFQRFHNGNDVLAIVKRFERRQGKEATR